MSVFYKPTPYNGCTKNQMWMSCIADSHDIHCGCEQPFAHLLDSIFPKDHKDRHLTIDQIIERDKKLCLSGGTEDEDHGMAAGTSAATENIKREDSENEEEDGLDALLAAAAEQEEKR